MNNLFVSLQCTLVSKKSQLFVSAIVLFFTLSSCSSDSTSSGGSLTKMLGKMVDVAANGSSTTSLFTYNVNKIVSVDGISKHILFYYTDDFITKVVTLDNASQYETVVNYTYAEGNLVKITSSENYVVNYVHNSDGSISYQKLTLDGNNNEILVYNGTLYFNDGNLIKDERILATSATEVSKEIISYQYDDKSNPLYNIVGFSKLLDNSSLVSVNNVIRLQEESRNEYIGTEQVASSVLLYVNVNQYDVDGYPTVIFSENAFFGVTTNNHKKTELFYN